VAILLFAVLFIGIVVYNIHFFSKMKAPNKPLRVELQSTPEEDFNLPILKRKAFDEGWGRNPFFRLGEEAITQSSSEPLPPSLEPTVQEEVPLPPLKLEMIFTADGKRRAILSGQLVKEGDRIAGEMVAKIEADRVVLEKTGNQRTIKLDSFFNPFRIEGGR
jgi:hypothetical protein